MFSKVRPIEVSRRFRSYCGRISCSTKANAGIVEWSPVKIADRSCMVLDEMEILRKNLKSWIEEKKQKMIIFENCEFLFQDEQSAREGCWLYNLALTYDFDLNKVFFVSTSSRKFFLLNFFLELFPGKNYLNFFLDENFFNFFLDKNFIELLPRKKFLNFFLENNF